MSELPAGDEYAARLRVLAERVNGFVYAGDRLDAVVDTVRALRADPELARALLSGVPVPSEPPSEARPALVCGCGIAPKGALGAVGCSPSCMTPEPDVTEPPRVDKWEPRENCYYGGPEEIYAHRLGTGYYCRRSSAEHREETP